MPGHQDRETHGYCDGRRLLRRRQRRAACRDGRRGCSYRPAARGAVLSCHREDHRSLQADWRRRGASGLRLSFRAGGICRGFEESEDHFHRPERPRDRSDGRQDRIQESGGSGESFDRAGISRRDRRRKARDQDRRRDRLSGDDQGFRRRRRQGHAHRALPRRG